ncbi:dnaJ homolog subfamily C member 5 isoform X1 [Microcebus murinus]|uniref:dnaJ homolog subfamily C member 5 isoform X1 n=1 Tax=Microcebus murinus TaxID=30608 RepID=UPI003F6CA73F
MSPAREGLGHVLPGTTSILLRSTCLCRARFTWDLFALLTGPRGGIFPVGKSVVEGVGGALLRLKPRSLHGVSSLSLLVTGTVRLLSLELCPSPVCGRSFASLPLPRQRAGLSGPCVPSLSLGHPPHSFKPPVLFVINPFWTFRTTNGRTNLISHSQRDYEFWCGARLPVPCPGDCVGQSSPTPLAFARPRRSGGTRDAGSPKDGLAGPKVPQLREGWAPERPVARPRGSELPPPWPRSRVRGLVSAALAAGCTECLPNLQWRWRQGPGCASAGLAGPNQRVVPKPTPPAHLPAPPPRTVRGLSGRCCPRGGPVGPELAASTRSWGSLFHFALLFTH